MLIKTRLDVSRIAEPRLNDRILNSVSREAPTEGRPD
jgi:hypothetical protein